MLTNAETKNKRKLTEKGNKKILKRILFKIDGSNRSR